MKRFILPISIAIPALLAGVAIGHYTTLAPVSSPTHASASTTSLRPAGPTNAPRTTPTPIVRSLAAEAEEPEAAPTSGNIIDRMKAALARPGGRRTYATFSKLADSIDPNNVRQVLAFAEGLQNPQEKSMVLSLVVGRWAEFEPQAAIE
ncbi:MAG TPA: hypothetical protein VK993_09185, partial [Chthoniobacterales bacterium]|nr:hypothetical protein [Chthoniobacterales bacterium]